MGDWRRTPHEAPSITVESAEGEAAYPGFNGDQASSRAKRHSIERLDEIRRRHEAEASGSPTQPEDGSGGAD